MSRQPADVGEQIAFLVDALRKVPPLHSRLHELAYERGSSSADKVRVPLGDPTGELVVQAYAENGELTSVGHSRRTLDSCDRKLDHLEREVRAIVVGLSRSLRAASPGLPTRGVTTWSQADADEIDREYWDRRRWPHRVHS